MRIIISQKLQTKLTEKHKVTRKEVEECFENKRGRLLQDDREDHRTDPPTQWFIAETHHLRELKIVFVRRGDDIFLKSAFEPDAEERRIYKKYGAW